MIGNDWDNELKIIWNSPNFNKFYQKVLNLYSKETIFPPKVEVFAKNGLTLTDAVNVFFQQVLNTGGFPFSVTEDNSEKMRAKALSKLMKELEIGMDCTESYSEEEAKKLLGL